MRTSLVVKNFADGYARACKPDDTPEAWKKTPGYVAAHQASGMNRKGQTTWREPESVLAAKSYFRPKHGIVNEIREIDPDSIRALEDIDVEREAIAQRLAELRNQEQEVLENAYWRAKPVKLDTIKQWSEIRRAAYDASRKAGA